ncbi:MAG: hypothetical protein ABI356_10350 [Steroidobacteraceae bacterium]
MTVNGLSFDNLSQANQALGQDLKQLKGKTAISLADALKFIGDYNEREVYRAFGPTSAEFREAALPATVRMAFINIERCV